MRVFWLGFWVLVSMTFWLMVALAAMTVWATPVHAERVDNELPLYRCDPLIGIERLLCVISQASYREPKSCPEIGLLKIVPQSAACERGGAEKPPSPRVREPSTLPQ